MPFLYLRQVTKKYSVEFSYTKALLSSSCGFQCCWNCTGASRKKIEGNTGILALFVLT